MPSHRQSSHQCILPGMLALSRRNVIQIIGDITQDSYKEFSRQLAELEKTKIKSVVIELMSDGGEAMAALAFYSRIRSSRIGIAIHAVGTVASAAVLILAAGDKRLMDAQAWVMVHEDYAKLKGSTSSMVVEAGQMQRLEEQWCGLLDSQTKTTASEWARLHKETTYLCAEECLSLGLIDEIV